MSTQTLYARLTPLFEANKGTLHLIHRLAKLPAQPGSQSFDPDASNARLNLSTEIHQSLKEQEEDFEILQQEVEDQVNNSSWTSATRRKDSEKERAKADLATQVARLGENLKTARAQFRKAQLQAKRNEEAAKHKERELLFADAQQGNHAAGQSRRKGKEKLSQEDVVLSASNDVTAALERTHALMQSELERSQFAHEALQESTAALSTLSESYANLDTLLSSSRSLVSTLLHSQKSDTWYLENALRLLLCTIGWLLFRRLIYGPGWWLLYLPTKLLFRLTFSVFQLLFGAFATLAGTLGPATQSSAISEFSERASTSLIVKPSATGAIPKIPKDMSVPPIAAGAGGMGAKEKAPDRSKTEEERKGLSDQIGEMAENSQKAQAAEENDVSEEQGDRDAPEKQGETTLRKRGADEPPNPKKRMWEESTERKSQEENHPRDEL